MPKTKVNARANGYVYIPDVYMQLNYVKKRNAIIAQKYRKLI